MKGAIITYLLTYGGAATSLYNPFYGLLVYVCFAIVRPEAMWHWSVPPGNYSRIVAVALLAGWALKGFGNWNFGRARGAVGALVAFWVWGMLSASQAPDQPTAWEFVEAMSKIVLPFLVGITTIDSRRKLHQLAWVILLSQAYAAYEFNVSYFAGVNTLWHNGFGGFDNNCIAIAMVTCVGLALFLGLQTPRWWLKGLALGSALLLVHAILFSFSRGGMLGLVVVGVTAMVLLPKTPRYLTLYLLGVLATLALAGPQVQKRFLSTFEKREKLDSSAATRLELWSRCVDAMAHEPVFGLGPQHWHIAVKKRYGWATGQEAHTLWLQTGAELGVPGLLFLVLFYGTCMAGCAAALYRLHRGPPGSEPALDVCLARCVVAALAGFAVSAQFVSVELLELPFYIGLLGAGVLKLSTPPAQWPAPAAGPTLPRRRPRARTMSTNVNRGPSTPLTVNGCHAADHPR